MACHHLLPVRCSECSQFDLRAAAFRGFGNPFGALSIIAASEAARRGVEPGEHTDLEPKVRAMPDGNLCIVSTVTPVEPGEHQPASLCQDDPWDDLSGWMGC